MQSLWLLTVSIVFAGLVVTGEYRFIVFDSLCLFLATASDARYTCEERYYDQESFVCVCHMIAFNTTCDDVEPLGSLNAAAAAVYSTGRDHGRLTRSTVAFTKLPGAATTSLNQLICNFLKETLLALASSLHVAIKKFLVLVARSPMQQRSC